MQGCVSYKGLRRKGLLVSITVLSASLTILIPSVLTKGVFMGGRNSEFSPCVSGLRVPSRETPTPLVKGKTSQRYQPNVLCRGLCPNPAVLARATACNSILPEPIHVDPESNHPLVSMQLELTSPHSFSLRSLSSGLGGRRRSSGYRPVMHSCDRESDAHVAGLGAEQGTS